MGGEIEDESISGYMAILMENVSSKVPISLLETRIGEKPYSARGTLSSSQTMCREDPSPQACLPLPVTTILQQPYKCLCLGL